MTINRNNYEIYFLDYFEGKLEAKLVDELMQFLELNHDLKEEFDAFENISIAPEKNVIFPDKAKLKKSPVLPYCSINAENYTERFVASAEGNLNEKELAELDRFIELNPVLKKEIELFRKARLAIDTTIVFEDKELLKKNVAVPFAMINAANYQEYMIAMIEGDLNPAEEKDFAEFMALNPGLRKEFSLFEQTIIEPDVAIVYEGKEQLKKVVESTVYTLNTAARQTKVFRLRNILYPLSIAASVIIILSVYYQWNSVNLPSGRISAYNSGIEINRAVSPATLQNTNIDSDNKNFHSTINSSLTNSDIVQFADNSLKPERIHHIGFSPIVAPVNKNQIKMEPDNTYRELYAIIREKKRNQEPTQKKDSPYYSLDQFALYNVKKSLKPKEERSNVKPDDKLSMWDLADAGIRGFNNLTGAEAKLHHSGDNSFSLALGDRISYSRGGKK